LFDLYIYAQGMRAFRIDAIIEKAVEAAPMPEAIARSAILKNQKTKSPHQSRSGEAAAK
jgi:hypothetical protein